MYYVSMIWAFSDPPTYALKVINRHKYSTEPQQNWQFSRPTHPILSWSNVWMVPYSSPWPFNSGKNNLFRLLVILGIIEIKGFSYQKNQTTSRNGILFQNWGGGVKKRQKSVHVVVKWPLRNKSANWKTYFSQFKNEF